MILKRSKSAIILLLCLSFLLTACAGDTPITPETSAGSTAGTPSSTQTPTKEVTTGEPSSSETPKDTRMLYNGIYLPEEWPPQDVSKDFNTVIDIPYLTDISDGGTHPDVVNIDVGRQLFVDDFLIESTTLTTTYHQATPYEGNPVFKTDRESGFHMKHGGVWYDEETKTFEMWYNTGNGVGYATGKDGITWVDQGMVLRFEGKGGAYATVIKDTNAGPDDPKFYMLVRRGNTYHDPNSTEKDHEHYPTTYYYSYNGRIWRIIGNGPTSGDASALVYNPFRDLWQLSLRRSYKGSGYALGRCRDYLEIESLLKITSASEQDVVFWQRADALDEWDSALNYQPEIYSLCAVGYESIMLGAFQMLQGPENKEMAQTGIPKITNIVMGYSRDGFYYSRPDRSAFLESSQTEGAWDRGYLHPTGSVCLIVGDELWFYYSGYEGDQSLAGTGSTGGALNRCSFGLAKLRRDGFASMDGSGELLTRKMTVTKGQKYLFVNAVAASLKAEVLDADGHVIEGFSMDDCTPFSGDSTCTMLSWGDRELSELSGTTFQIRFEMTDGSLYAFWLSATTDGDSGGATAGGLVELN